MISKEFETVIKIISKKLNQESIKWSLVGSTNLAIQGMNVSPRDLDILVKWSDLKKIKAIFSQYNPSEIKKLMPFIDGQKAWEMKTIINDIEVQFFSEKVGEYVKRLLPNKIIKIKLNNLEIPCSSLEDEAQIYENTNRKNKADMINDFLKRAH